MKKEIIVKLGDDREVVVRKLALREYADLLKTLDGLPKSLSELDATSNDDILSNLPSIVAVALPEVIKIIAFASKLTEEEVDELGLDEAVELLAAIIEVNQISKVAEKVKKLLARRQAAPKTATGSIAQ